MPDNKLQIDKNTSIEALRDFVEQSGNLEIQGRKGDQGYEIYAGQQSDLNIEDHKSAQQNSPVSERGQQLGKSALFEVLAHSYGAQAAALIFTQMDGKLFVAGGLTLEHVNEALTLVTTLKLKKRPSYEAPKAPILNDDKHKIIYNRPKMSDIDVPVDHGGGIPSGSTSRKIVKNQKANKRDNARINKIHNKQIDFQQKVRDEKQTLKDIAAKTRERRKQHSLQMIEMRKKGIKRFDKPKALHEQKALHGKRDSSAIDDGDKNAPWTVDEFLEEFQDQDVQMDSGKPSLDAPIKTLVSQIESIQNSWTSLSGQGSDNSRKDIRADFAVVEKLVAKIKVALTENNRSSEQIRNDVSDIRFQLDVINLNSSKSIDSEHQVSNPVDNRPRYVNYYAILADNIDAYLNEVDKQQAPDNVKENVEKVKKKD